MFELIGGLFSLAFGLVKAGLSLAWGLISGIFGLLGGLFSLLISLGGMLLAGSLVLLAVMRRKEYKNRRSHPYEESQPTGAYDVDTEEFSSFYDQYRTQE